MSQWEVIKSLLEQITWGLKQFHSHWGKRISVACRNRLYSWAEPQACTAVLHLCTMAWLLPCLNRDTPSCILLLVIGSCNAFWEHRLARKEKQTLCLYQCKEALPGCADFVPRNVKEESSPQDFRAKETKAPYCSTPGSIRWSLRSWRLCSGPHRAAGASRTHLDSPWFRLHGAPGRSHWAPRRRWSLWHPQSSGSTSCALTAGPRHRRACSTGEHHHHPLLPSCQGTWAFWAFSDYLGPGRLQTQSSGSFTASLVFSSRACSWGEPGGAVTHRDVGTCGRALAACWVPKGQWRWRPHTVDFYMV